MKQAHGNDWYVRLLALFLCAFVSDVLFPASTNAQEKPEIISEQSPKVSSFTPFRVGVFASLARTFSTEPLVAIPGVVPFPAALDVHEGRFLSGGIELQYRLNSPFELALRAEYSQFAASVVGNERTVVSLRNPQSPAMFVPTPVTIRNTLSADVRYFSVVPQFRWFAGEVFFVGIGARFDAPLQTFFRYRLETTDLPFVVSNAVRLDTSLQAPTAQNALAVSPFFATGLSLPIGRFRLIAEGQFQPFFQPFRAFSLPNPAQPGGALATRNPWTLLAARLNLGLVVNFDKTLETSSEENTTPQSEKTQSEKTQTRQSKDSSALAAFVPALVSVSATSSTFSPTVLSSSPKTTMLPASSRESPAKLIDTTFQRDTVIRVVAWNLVEKVLLQEQILERTNSDKVLENESFNDLSVVVRQRFVREIPKPKPALVGNLDIRFVPNLNAAKNQESKQISKMSVRPMILRKPVPIRSSDNENNTFSSGFTEKFDTVSAVRMPILRFLPTISSEVGLQMQSIRICQKSGNGKAFNEYELFGLPQFGASLLGVPQKSFDWDAQVLLFSSADERTDTENKTENKTENEIDTLVARLFVTDNELQSIVADTVGVVVERSDEAVSGKLGGRQNFSVGEVSRWTLASLRLVKSTQGVDSSKKNNLPAASYTIAETDFPLRERIKTLFSSVKTNNQMSGSAGKNRSPKNITVYAEAPSDLVFEEIVLLQKALPRIVGSLGIKVESASLYVMRKVLPETNFLLHQEKNRAIPVHDVYIRAVIEE